MVERVALALCTAFERDPNEIWRVWSDDTGVRSETQLERHRRAARAAIEAMREPTEEMILNGYACRSACHMDECKTPVECMWSEMIDDALSEDKGSSDA